LALLCGGNSHLIPVQKSDTGVSFVIKVHPRAKKNAITGELGDALKVALTAPPVEGKANEACIEFFAKLLKVPRSSVSIASGQNSRNKVIRVTGLTSQQVRERFGV
jgi:uncharacterized protein (TIGR00251 family)